MTTTVLGLTVPDLAPGNLTADQRREVVEAVCAAMEGVTDAGGNEQVAREAFAAATSALDRLAREASWASVATGEVLRQIPRTVAVSRGAVVSSPVEWVPGLVRDVVLDAVEAWSLTGHWEGRSLSAVEVLDEFAQVEGEEALDPVGDPVIRDLVARARREAVGE